MPLKDVTFFIELLHNKNNIFRNLHFMYFKVIFYRKIEALTYFLAYMKRYFIFQLNLKRRVKFEALTQLFEKVLKR